MTKAQIRELRYNTVRNATADPKVARQARDWSEKKILLELGIKLPKKTPALKELPENRTKATLGVRRYQYALDKGLKPEEALRVKHSSFRKIDSEARYLYPSKRPETIRTRADERKIRIEQWKQWARDKNYPPSIKKQAEDVNASLSPRGDKTDRYGWNIAFYSYIEQLNIDFVKENILPDRIDYNLSGQYQLYT